MERGRGKKRIYIERERETVKKKNQQKCFTLQKYLKHASHYAARV